MAITNSARLVKDRSESPSDSVLRIEIHPAGGRFNGSTRRAVQRALESLKTVHTAHGHNHGIVVLAKRDNTTFEEDVVSCVQTHFQVILVEDD